MDDIHEYLLLKGVEAVAIHGSKSKFIMINMYLLYLVRSPFINHQVSRQLRKNVNSR